MISRSSSWRASTASAHSSRMRSSKRRFTPYLVGTCYAISFGLFDREHTVEPDVQCRWPVGAKVNQAYHRASAEQHTALKVLRQRCSGAMLALNIAHFPTLTIGKLPRLFGASKWRGIFLLVNSSERKSLRTVDISGVPNPRGTDLPARCWRRNADRRC
jgi:hypothetical protein